LARGGMALEAAFFGRRSIVIAWMDSRRGWAYIQCNSFDFDTKHAIQWKSRTNSVEMNNGINSGHWCIPPARYCSI
jgi:hypothetical protein